MEHKRTVLKLAFADRLLYCRKEGYRTATPALPTLLLQKLNGNMGENSGQKSGMVAPAGLEPARPFELAILSRVRLPFRHGAFSAF